MFVIAPKVVFAVVLADVPRTARRLHFPEGFPPTATSAANGTRIPFSISPTPNIADTPGVPQPNSLVLERTKSSWAENLYCSGAPRKGITPGTAGRFRTRFVDWQEITLGIPQKTVDPAE
jgi:hypothetical protein